MHRIIIVVLIGVALTACGGSGGHTTTTTPVADCPEPADATAGGWDSEAAAEVEASMRAMLAAWNARDLDAVRGAVSGEVLPSYDSGMGGKPIVWRSHDDVVEHAGRVFASAGQSGTNVTSNVRSVSCQATATFGVCSAEVEAQVSPGQGEPFTFPYRATYVAHRTDDGWVSSHWHASPAADASRWGESATHSVDDVEEWTEMPVGDGTIEVAVVQQDPSTGRTAMFVRFPRRWESGRHIHTAAHHSIVLEGSLTITDANGEQTELGAGSYRRAFAGEPHSAVAGRRGATMLIISDGRFGTIPVDEEGNPVEPAPEGEEGEDGEEAEE